jgi:hypothetical protein
MFRNSRGVTLIETLFSFFLCSLVMYALASTLSSAVGIQGRRKEVDQSSETFHVLNLMCKDVASQHRVIRPNLGSTDNALVVERIDPNKSFAERVNTPSGPDPYEPSERLEIAYTIDDHKLIRTIRTATAPGTPQILMDCEQLEARRTGDLVSISITFQESKKLVQRSIQVSLR